MDDFKTLVTMLGNAKLFFETWKDETGYLYITCGGRGMDVQFQCDAETGQLTAIESLKENAA